MRKGRGSRRRLRRWGVSCGVCVCVSCCCCGCCCCCHRCGGVSCAMSVLCCVVLCCAVLCCVLHVPVYSWEGDMFPKESAYTLPCKSFTLLRHCTNASAFEAMGEMVKHACRLYSIALARRIAAECSTNCFSPVAKILQRLSYPGTFCRHTIASSGGIGFRIHRHFKERNISSAENNNGKRNGKRRHLGRSGTSGWR